MVLHWRTELDRTDDFKKFCRSGLDWIQFYRIRTGLGLKNFTVRSSLLARWPTWSFTKPKWRSDTRLYDNQLFCHCVFIYSDFHWWLVSLIREGSQYCRCSIAESCETIININLFHPWNDWLDKSNWIHSRESGPVVLQRSGDVAASPILLGPVLICSQ